MAKFEVCHPVTHRSCLRRATWRRWPRWQDPTRSFSIVGAGRIYGRSAVSALRLQRAGNRPRRTVDGLPCPGAAGRNAPSCLHAVGSRSVAVRSAPASARFVAVGSKGPAAAVGRCETTNIHCACRACSHAESKSDSCDQLPFRFHGNTLNSCSIDAQSRVKVDIGSSAAEARNLTLL